MATCIQVVSGESPESTGGGALEGGAAHPLSASLPSCARKSHWKPGGAIGALTTRPLRKAKGYTAVGAEHVAKMLAVNTALQSVECVLLICNRYAYFLATCQGPADGLCNCRGH